MPSQEFRVAQAVGHAIQYTGSNSADIDSQVPGITITSEAGGVLTLDSSGYEVILNTTDWIIWNSFQTFGLPNSLYHREWDCVALCADIAQVNASTSNVFVRGIGVAPVPTLATTEDTMVSVPIQPAMPDSGFSAYAAVFGGDNPDLLSITSVTVVDVDTVDVIVENTGGVTVSGVTVMVHAID